ncbi:MAG: serine/threonine protein kinase [Spirochaetes bacterium]|nr:serine/threonine protein kinase [Spirochaetota bacterium]
MIDFRDEHIVQVYDFFKEGNSYYIAMEYIKGISLSDLIRKKKYIPNDIAILIFSEICRALKYAHDKGVIHRDIKPANILISNDGEVKLTDFGIARLDEGQTNEKEEGLTADGMTLGTPAYMAPEQISDSKNVDRRADIYSMGVVLYEMVTGKCPFSGSFTPDAVAQIQRGDYLPPGRVNPDTAPVIKKIIKKAMHRKAKRRYKDLRYILAILKRYLRKYKNINSINQTIKEFLQGKPGDASQKESGTVKKILKRVLDVAVLTVSTNFARIITGITLLLLAFAGTGYYMYLKGMHYEYLKASEYGALRIEVKTDKKYKTPEEKYIRLDLFRISGGRFIPIKDPAPSIDRAPAGEGRYYYTLATKKMYLQSGSYRLAAQIENELFEKDFTLEPRILQKTMKDTAGCAVIRINHIPAQRVPLSLYYASADALTKKDMTAETDLYVYYNKWYKWKDFVRLKKFEDIFTTGRTYKFQFFNEKYFTNFLRVSVSPFQSVLSIETEMVPLPGTLFYKSNIEGIKFFINNSDHYLSGAKTREYLKIEPANSDYKKLKLAPGNYLIKAEKTGLSEKIEVAIEPGKSVNIFINYDSSADKISIELPE